MLHEMGAHHPEQPARLDAISDRLISSGLDMVLRHYEAPKAQREHLLRVHDGAYVDGVFHSSPREGLVWLDDDTAMNPYTLEAALYAAGAVVLGVDLVLEGRATQAFCAVRRPFRPKRGMLIAWSATTPCPRSTCRSSRGSTRTSRSRPRMSNTPST